jgi:hypothetical protein
MPSVTDLEGFTYLQQERKGVLLGVYERTPKHWKTEGAEWDFGMELFPEEIDRISPELMLGFDRFPTLHLFQKIPEASLCQDCPNRCCLIMVWLIPWRGWRWDNFFPSRCGGQHFW